MYSCVKHFEVNFIDVDAYDNLKLSSLLSYLEDVACISAEELGFGYEALKAKNFGFILSNWYVELKRPVKLGEKLTINTWPLKPRFFVFLRDFEIYCGSEKIGVATSRWCMFKLDDYSLVPASAYFNEGDFDGYNTNRSVEFSDWKIRNVPEGERIYTKTVRNSDYDHYFHVHNTRYADFLLDAFDVAEFKNKSIVSAQINYLKQCKQNDKIEFTKSEADDCYIVEGFVGDENRVQMRVRFNAI